MEAGYTAVRVRGSPTPDSCGPGTQGGRTWSHWPGLGVGVSLACKGCPPTEAVTSLRSAWFFLPTGSSQQPCPVRSGHSGVRATLTHACLVCPTEWCVHRGRGIRVHLLQEVCALGTE